MFDMRLLSNEQASQMNGVAKTGQRKTKAASLLGVRGEDNVIPQQTKGDMGEDTGVTTTTTTTISRIITGRADSSEDRGRLAAVIGERDGRISATQKSRR
jgi:hypothetical protein